MGYRFCENFIKIGPVALALDLGAHNDNNIGFIRTDLFLNHFFGSKDLKVDNYVESST